MDIGLVNIPDLVAMTIGISAWLYVLNDVSPLTVNCITIDYANIDSYLFLMAMVAATHTMYAYIWYNPKGKTRPRA